MHAAFPAHQLNVARAPSPTTDPIALPIHPSCKTNRKTPCNMDEESKTARDAGPSHQTTSQTLICYPLELAATRTTSTGGGRHRESEGGYRASPAAEEARGDAGRHSPESRRRRAGKKEGTSTTDLIWSLSSISVPCGRGDQ
jgi:hypothetical protein